MVKWIKIGLFTSALLPVWGTLDARVTSPSEYEIKAAFIYNFAKFVEWPLGAFKNSEDTFVVGILGEDPFDKNTEEELNTKTVQDKKLVFRRLTSLQDVPHCQMIFISRSEEDHLNLILDKVKG